MALFEYQKKRKFKRTPEPKGKVAKSKGKLTFVVQKHAATRLHYDFRIELDGVLKSWAVPKGPSMNPLDQRLAIQVEDHPLEYGNFEGIIPKGNYGAGTVMVWDRGTYEDRFAEKGKTDQKKLLQRLLEGHLTLVLHGKKLSGEFALVKLKGKRSDGKSWLLLKKRDSFAKFRPAAEVDDKSAKTGRTMEQIAGRAEKKKEVWLPKRAEIKPSTLPLRSKPPLTHLSKIYFPKDRYTKGDVVGYYESIAEYILPHLKDRALSLRRQPNGISGFGFYQKDMVGFVPSRVKTVRISSSSKKTVNFLMCQDLYSLLYMANLGCIEIHPWLSRIDSLGKPDFSMIDLDPDRQKFDEVVKVALEVQKVLKSIGIKGFCKTSGATGIHICVPTGARYDYATSRIFAEKVCREVNRRLPLLTTMERNPARRRGKLYLDHLQNAWGQTLASVYSLRPVDGAPVSTPLKWSEVKKGLDPLKFNIKNTAARLKRVGDLWKDTLKVKNDLVKGIRDLSH